MRTSFITLALLSLSLGCSSSEETPATGTDAGADVVVDTGKIDTGKVDTGTATDTGSGPTCEYDVPSDFACGGTPAKTAGQTTCTDAMLEELVQKCLAADLSVPSACAEWKTANAACAACVGAWSWDDIPGKVYPDDYKCYWSTFDATCAKNVSCLFSCQYEVCQDCEGDEANDCYSNSESAGGKCWDVAGKAADACFKSTDTTGCNVNEIYKDSPNLTTMREQILKFYRGACRDNANWKNATMPSGDAGSDAPAETSAETSVTDAVADAVTDATDAD
jgi:hypothetical protein